MNGEDGEGITVRHMRIEHLAPVFHLGEKLFTLKESPSLYRTGDGSRIH
jgi:hypothetical protein